jgi:hypothetical protein
MLLSTLSASNVKQSRLAGWLQSLPTIYLPNPLTQNL